MDRNLICCFPNFTSASPFILRWYCRRFYLSLERSLRKDHQNHCICNSERSYFLCRVSHSWHICLYGWISWQSWLCMTVNLRLAVISWIGNLTIFRRSFSLLQIHRDIPLEQSFKVMLSEDTKCGKNLWCACR